MATHHKQYRPSVRKSSTADARKRGRERALREEKPAIPGIAWFLIIAALITVIAVLCINSRNADMEEQIAAAKKRNAEIIKKNEETQRKAQEDRERRKREKDEKMAAMRSAAAQQQPSTQNPPQPQQQPSTPAL